MPRREQGMDLLGKRVEVVKERGKEAKSLFGGASSGVCWSVRLFAVSVESKGGLKSFTRKEAKTSSF